jgi:2-polyprenyl-3-methyl-5-hydroxy-6-metoxy-1,4-benzoquinol methylase
VEENLKSRKEIFASVDAPSGIREDNGIALKPCFLCGSSRADRLYMQAHFPVVKCQECGLVYADEHFRQEDLNLFYFGDYYKRAYVCHPSEIDRKISRDYVKAFDRVDRYLGGGRILDFGCARGTFLDELRHRGYEERWEIHGVDINPEEVQMGVERGLPIRCQTLEDACFKEGEFDAVTAFSVMEHLQEPAPILKEFARILRQGGLLLTIVPSGECLILDIAVMATKLLGNLVRPITDNVFHEEHLYYFTRESIAQALEGAGFEPLDFFYYPSYLETHPPGLLVPLGAYPLRFFSWALRKQTMLGVVARCR